MGEFETRKYSGPGAPKCLEEGWGCGEVKMKASDLPGGHIPRGSTKCKHRYTLRCSDNDNLWHLYRKPHKFVRGSRRLAQVPDCEAPSLVGVGLLSSALLTGAYLIFRCLRRSRDKGSLPLY